VRRCLLACPNWKFAETGEQLPVNKERCGECGSWCVRRTWEDVYRADEFFKRVPPEEGDLIREEWR
jgi:hypothetical protein